MSEMGKQKINGDRRRFLTHVAGGAVAVAPGITLISTAQAKGTAETGADSRKRWGMLIDTNKCENGCNDCVTACQQENGWGAASSDESLSRDSQKAQWVRIVNIRDKQTGFENSVPVMCQHCANPACVDVCPTGASHQRVDGVVLVDKHICIGCRYCMMACPYKARSFIHESLHQQKGHAPRGKGTVESCTLCVHRVDHGGQPACVESCRNGAMIFGDLNDPNSEISHALKQASSTQIRADLGLEPGVHYRGI